MTELLTESKLFPFRFVSGLVAAPTKKKAGGGRPSHVSLLPQGGNVPIIYYVPESGDQGFFKGAHRPVEGTLITASLGFDDKGVPLIRNLAKGLTEEFQFRVTGFENAKGQKPACVLGQITGDHPRAGNAKLVLDAENTRELSAVWNLMNKGNQQNIQLTDIVFNVQNATELRDGIFKVPGPGKD